MLHRGTKPAALYRGSYKPGALYKGAQLIAGYADVSKAAPATWEGTYDHVMGVTATGRGKQDGTPTPTAPVPLVAAEGSLTASGRNMLMTNRETYQMNGITVERLADGRYHISGTPTAESSLWLSYEISLPLSAGTYTLAQTPAADELDVRVLLLPGWKQEFFVLTEATTITGCYINVPPSAVGQELDFVYGPQLERGGTAHPYRPYAVPTTVTLPTLRAIPGTDIRDTLAYIGGGQWQITRRVGVVQLDGTETWTVGGLRADKADWYYQSPNLPDAVDSSVSSSGCTHYQYALIANNQTRQGCGIVWRAIRVRWGDPPDGTDAWKAFLAAQAAAGTPVTVWYELVTPATETVTLGTLYSYPVQTTLDISGDFPFDVVGTCKTGI